LDFNSWEQGSHEIFSRRSATVRATRWVGTEVREQLVYDGTSFLENFLHNMKENVREDKKISVLDVAFQNTPSKWWMNHKAVLRTWDERKQAIKYRF
jgi:dolichyl-phosphate-mannose--protein O-mannosyl transferase